MKTASFIAILEPATEGFGVYFPDLPGCTSAGATASEAARNALDAIALHLEGMAEGGDPIPEPTALDAIEVPKGAAPLVVPVALPGKVERINVTMDEGMLMATDRLAKEFGLSRSGLFVELIREKIADTMRSSMRHRVKEVELLAIGRGRRTAPEDPQNPRGLKAARMESNKIVPRSVRGEGRKVTGVGRRLKAD